MLIPMTSSFYARGRSFTVREIGPDIMLVPSPEDYMDPVRKDVVIDHAMPYGLRDGLRRLIVPDFYVDITRVIVKEEGWRRHNHLGLSSREIDPLKEILMDCIFAPLP